MTERREVAMKKLIILVILIMSGSIAGLAAARHDRTVSLKIGQAKNVPHSRLRIRFIAVLEDSRCPVGTQCIWAGNARVKVELSEGGRRVQTMGLDSSGTSNAVTFAGYKVKLVSLSPKPGEKGKARASNNVAVFSVERIK
jgi:hypothetical protein